MTQPQLGRLERVDLRAAWNHEARDFTPWLASGDNIRLLGDTLGIDTVTVGWMDRVIRPRIKALDAADWTPPAPEER